ncbi:hypothetical protein GCM10023084_74030 [Streptomyces lacrimifluminis]|uniref:Uncharacterized protein n=1 Tax=Streptomyces lacrimifluminis TaxID=1500077 RepID=A0A917UKT7_9ACTN|nr:hypothetical protein GCM10012282_72050 [Streptomyces lacrimifluminis]
MRRADDQLRESDTSPGLSSAGAGDKVLPPGHQVRLQDVVTADRVDASRAGRSQRQAAARQAGADGDGARQAVSTLDERSCAPSGLSGPRSSQGWADPDRPAQPTTPELDWTTPF